MRKKQLPVVVSIGDPAGIGPEIILKACHTSTPELPAHIVLGDPVLLEERARLLNLDCKIETITSLDCEYQPEKGKVLVLPLSGKMVSGPGSPDPSDGKLTIEAIERGVELVMSKQAAGIVTCPINKKVLYDSGFEHPGHTEFLGALAEKHTKQISKPVMLLAGPKLKTIPVTIHIPLMDVASQLTTDLIVETCEITDRDLKSQFNIEAPRLAVSGLNPHAGEDNSMGHEDTDIIVPAIERLQKIGIDARGPMPADTMFHASARETYDVAICMYHDQALIPAKTLAFDEAVNVTLGLPFIRTSPDHGTAYDIAGKGIAKTSSYIAALNMASQMADEKLKMPALST